MVNLSPTRSRILAAASITAALVTAACGSSQHTTPRVASLSAPSSAAASGAAATTRPVPARSKSSAAPIRLRLKLNGTTAENNAAYAPYYACFRRHGIHVSAALGVKSGMNQAPGSRGAKAMKDCAVNLPLPPIENDPKNPHAIDFNRAVAACLRTKGVRYVDVVTEDGRVGISAGGPDNDSRSISLTGQYLTACEEQASRGGH